MSHSLTWSSSWLGQGRTLRDVGEASVAQEMHTEGPGRPWQVGGWLQQKVPPRPGPSPGLRAPRELGEGNG